MQINSHITFCIIGACLILPFQVLSQTPKAILPKHTNLVKVAENYVKLLDENKLPGISKNEHGKANTYPLTPDLQKEWRTSKLLDDRMLSDIKSCREAYVVAVETKETNKFLRYFFCVENGEVKLVSAYHFPKSRWLKLALKEKVPGAKDEPKVNGPR